VRWTEDETKIPVRKEEIVGKFNVLSFLGKRTGVI
jgi:hypothetical protein